VAVLQIRTAPDPVLRRKTSRVTKIDAKIQQLIDDMFETMYAAHGVGLAANQVGVPLRLLVMGIPQVTEGAEEEDGAAKIEEIALINPEFVKKGGEREVPEGCLSIPGYRGTLKRAEWVKVKALDRNGREVRFKAEGLKAQALEHEIDHLDGVLYIDRMKDQGVLEQLVALTAEEPVEVAAE
jgi:peptide deformylase